MPNQKRLTIGHYFFIILSILATALSLAGYFGRLNMYLEFASNYKLQFLIIGLCSLCYFGLTRKKIGIIISLFCVLLNLAEMLPWYWDKPAIANLEAYRPLKVLSYNVLWSNKKYNKAIALIDREQPDIAIFQEAQAPWAKALTALKADYPYHVGATKLEIEVYSKFPLNNTKIDLYGTYRGLVIVDLQLSDKEIKFIATHAYPQLYYGREGWQIRNQHLEVGIGEYVGSLQQPAIVAGDLNVSMWSPFYHSLIAKSGLHNARQGFGILPSQSGIAPGAKIFSSPIDHCLVSSNIEVKNFRLGSDIGSDHLPIIIDLLIPLKS